MSSLMVVEDSVTGRGKSSIADQKLLGEANRAWWNDAHLEFKPNMEVPSDFRQIRSSVATQLHLVSANSNDEALKDLLHKFQARVPSVYTEDIFPNLARGANPRERSRVNYERTKTVKEWEKNATAAVEYVRSRPDLLLNFQAQTEPETSIQGSNTHSTTSSDGRPPNHEAMRQQELRFRRLAWWKNMNTYFNTVASQEKLLDIVLSVATQLKALASSSNDPMLRTLTGEFELKIPSASRNELKGLQSHLTLDRKSRRLAAEQLRSSRQRKWRDEVAIAANYVRYGVPSLSTASKTAFRRYTTQLDDNYEVQRRSPSSSSSRNTAHAESDNEEGTKVLTETEGWTSDAEESSCTPVEGNRVVGRDFWSVVN